MMKKHMKPNPQKNIKGGIAEQEATIFFALDRGAQAFGRHHLPPRIAEAPARIDLTML